MTSFRNALIAGISALGIVAGAMPAEAASAKSSPTVGGVRMSDIQTVRHGWGGGRGWGGGGRSWGGGGWGGRRYGGYYGRHRGGNWGGYAAAGIIGLGVGAALASPYRGGYGYGDGYYSDDDYGYSGRSYGYYDRPAYYAPRGYYAPRRAYYNDRPYRRSYGYSRARYGGAECQVISRQRDRYGNRVKVIRYRPC